MIDSWQFTSAQPFQSFVIGIQNGCARMRLEFILRNHHNTPTFESRVMKIIAWVPNTSHTKIEWVQTDSAILSYQLNPSNLSLQ
eukprot:scaffold141957_cov23-Cyclotella_meneghiniana.AAC.1